MRRCNRRTRIISNIDRLPFDRIALVLQGGGALGAYQAGVYAALHEAGIAPDCIAGISIGAINAALIAGNPPELRVARLREFWEQVTETANPWQQALPGPLEWLSGTALPTQLAHQFSASMTVLQGQPGFFRPHALPAWAYGPGAPEAVSFYDTSPLRETLARLVDFDRVNDGPAQVVLGAVNVRTGNFATFDSARTRLRPEHVMASGALPPGFPPVEVDGEHYWDGGLVSNTPLDTVLADLPPRDTLAFQVDLWSARGPLPQTMAEVMERQKDITYSSRTRYVTDRFAAAHRRNCAVARLLGKLPPDLAASPEAIALRREAAEAAVTVIHLIYADKTDDTYVKDYDFSRTAMEEHWQAGLADMRATLQHRDWLRPPPPEIGFVTHDLHREGRDSRGE